MFKKTTLETSANLFTKPMRMFCGILWLRKTTVEERSYSLQLTNSGASWMIMEALLKKSQDVKRLPHSSLLSA